MTFETFCTWSVMILSALIVISFAVALIEEFVVPIIKAFAGRKVEAKEVEISDVSYVNENGILIQLDKVLNG